MSAKTKHSKPQPKKRPARSNKASVNPLRRIIAIILLVIAIVSSTALVAASIAEFISPQLTPLPALLGLTFPIYAIATLLLFIALLIVYPKYALVPLFALLVAAKGMWQYCPINFDNNSFSTNRDSFTFLSYNTFYFYDTELEEPTYNRTLQNIINQNADIVAIQEGAMRFYPGGRHKITHEQLSQIKVQYPYEICENNNRILSKYPITTVMDTTYTPTAITGVYKVEIGNRTVTIINNHLESIGLTPDDKQLFTDLTSNPDSIEGRLGEMKLFTKKFLNAFERRAQQVAFVDSIANAIGGNVIICGDINDTPNSYAYRTLSRNREDAYLNLGTGPGYTYQADRMWVRIDYVLYQGDLEAKYLQRGKILSSDHYPLLVEFGWK